MIPHILAVLSLISLIQDASPAGILMAVNGALAAGLAALYRDCKKDRAALWSHVRELERRISGQ